MAIAKAVTPAVAQPNELNALIKTIFISWLPFLGQPLFPAQPVAPLRRSIAADRRFRRASACDRARDTQPAAPLARGSPAPPIPPNHGGSLHPDQIRPGNAPAA